MNNKQKAQLFMDRFHGRRDVYGRQWVGSKPDENGRIPSGYTPACDNLWAEACHIRLKDGVPCSKCEIKKYTEVSEATVMKHIAGDEKQMVYVVDLDGNVRFAAIDFDMKPGKEAIGYTFTEVAACAKVCQDLGVPYGIARSTTMGFHLYVFFEDAIPAVKARALIFEILARSGIMAVFHAGGKPLPEVYPKQDRAPGPGVVGSGIKPPMIEPQFAKERNCFVTDKNEMIPANLQWAHLAQIQKITTQWLDELIVREGIPVDEITNKGQRVASGASPRRKEWQPALTGSFEKVLEGCAAFRRVRDKCLKGESPNHHEGMALFHMAMHTADGIDWFKKNVPGWAQDDSDWKQLQQSIDKDYSPWTCKKLQESGVCVIGTKCFDKQPPYDRVDGQLVRRTDIPESQWPEPSPVRYAHSAGEDFLAKLMKEVDDLVNEEDEEAKSVRLAEVIRRGMVFDKNQQEVLKERIEKSGLKKRSQLNRQFNEARAEKDRHFEEVAKSRTDMIVVAGRVYKKLDPYGYAVVKAGKGDVELDFPFAHFDIILEEERIVIEDAKTRNRCLVGKFRSPGREIAFEVSDDIWTDNAEMYKFFFRLAGSDFNILKQDIDQLRQAVSEHNKSSRRKTNYYGTQGWYDGTYLMPSVLVDKDGVRPNTEKPVDLSKKEHASNLDFKLLSDSDFRETLFHLKTDFFNAFPRGPAFIGLGHTMSAGLIDYLNIKFRPILWMEGESGIGKSQLCILLQKFWGNFKGGANWRSTANSMADYGYLFRDALLLADDYKGTTPGQTVAVISTVHNAYEYTVRSAMGRDGQQRGDKINRSLYIMTGEVTPQNESSFIGRLVLIEYTRFDQTKTKAAFDRCFQHSDNYRGITPRFVHWILNQNRAEIQRDLAVVRDRLQKDMHGMNNESRIADNCGLAFCTWKLFVMFMQENGAVDKKEADALVQEAWAYIEQVRDTMAVRCQDEQTGTVFLGHLKEMLLTGRASIRHLEGFSNEDAVEIGFVDDKDKEPGSAYLHPGTVVELVKKNVSGHLVGTVQSVGNQFKSAGVIVKHDPKRLTTTKKYQGISQRVWQVSLDKMGLYADGKTPRVVHQTEPLPLEQPAANADGLI